TYQWGPGVRDYRDYTLPVSLLKKQRIDLSADPDQPGTLYYIDGSDPAAPRRPLGMVAQAPPTPVDFSFVATAHAQPAPAVSNAVLTDCLASPNPNLPAPPPPHLPLLTP